MKAQMRSIIKDRYEPLSSLPSPPCRAKRRPRRRGRARTSPGRRRLSLRRQKPETAEAMSSKTFFLYSIGMTLGTRRLAGETNQGEKVHKQPLLFVCHLQAGKEDEHNGFALFKVGTKLLEEGYLKSEGKGSQLNFFFYNLYKFIGKTIRELLRRAGSRKNKGSYEK